MAKTETDKAFIPRVGLRVWTDRDNGYFHIHAEPCVIGPRYRYEIERCKPEEVNGCGSGVYDSIRGLRLSGLQVCSQGNSSDEPRRLYGFSLEYRQVFSVDLNEAQQMAKTLTTIDKRLDKLAAKYGRTTTYSQFVARIADAIGADCIVLKNDAERKALSGEWHRIRDLKQGLYEIDVIEHEWIHERERAAEEAERARLARVAEQEEVAS